LSPLRGMPLTTLSFYTTNVSDLSPLYGMPLTGLFCNGTPAFDLSPLQGMNLAELQFTPKNITKGLDVARQMKSIKTIGTEYSKVFPAAEFWKKYDAGEFGKPAAPPKKLAYLDPAFQGWVKATQALPAEQQIEAVSKKLMELNPGFDGKLTGYEGKGMPSIDQGMVTGIWFFSDQITNIAPVRGLKGLQELSCPGSKVAKSKLSDLSPLSGMNLRLLHCGHSLVDDLTPLRGMQLKTLYCLDTLVSDLAPLQGVPLRSFDCSGTQVADLSPLRGMKLETLGCSSCPVSDLSPLVGMPLKTFRCSNNLRLSDVSPLTNIKTLEMVNVPICNVTPADVAALAKSLPNCKIEWPRPGQFFGQPAAPARLAYLDPAFQQWVKATQALPAEQQIEAVSKKLIELNPGFDGVLKPGIHNGLVYDIQFLPDNMTDISPVRALVKLNSLKCVGTVGAKTSTFSDLSPLQGMKLTVLNCGGTQVADLSPLREMPLTKLYCLYTPLSDLSPLTDIPTLTELKVQGTKVTAAQVAALQKALPNCQIEWDDPAKAAVVDMAAAGDGWLPLFNGRNLNGWSPQGYNGWSVANGALVGTAAGQRGWLMTDAVYADYEIQLEYKLGAEGNSGIFLGAQPGAPISGSEFCEVQLLDDAAAKYASLPANERNAAVYKKIAPSNAPTTPAGQWHRLRIACFGKHLRIELNGGKVIDSDVSEIKLQGHIGLQLYPPAPVEVRNISLRPLDPQGLPLRKQTATTPAAAAKKLAYLDPAFQQWVTATQALPAEQQIEAVGKKLMELNPGFDGTISNGYGKDEAEIKEGVVVDICIHVEHVTDISPLRAFSGVRSIRFAAKVTNAGKLTDLSPLAGMAISGLRFNGTKVTNLSPLAGMPLTNLNCPQTSVSDLTPLEQCKSLKKLDVRETKVTPAAVAALQKALPNCKIEWDDPAKP
jgi:Leucine-rich repeat (LRR) protein